MSEQLNLFSLFEDTFGDNTVIEEVAPAKEETKKEASKKASGKAKKADEKVTLPVTVYASAWKEEIKEIDGKTEVTIQELKDYLVAEGYVEIKMFSTVVTKEEDKVVVGTSGLPSYANTPMLKEEVTIAAGQFTMQLTDADLEGLDKNIGTLARKWEENNPQYKGAKVIFDLSCGVGYPIAGESVENVPAGTASYYYNGAVQEITLDAETPKDDFIQKVTGVSGGMVYKTEEGIYFPLIVRKTGKGSNSSSSSSKKGAPTPPPEVKFTLPVKVVFTVHDDVVISTEQFPEKTEVTEKELIKWLGDNIADEYTEDKTELLLFKSKTEGEPDVIEARYKSSKKG